MLTMAPPTAGLSSIPALFSNAFVSPVSTPVSKESQGPTQATGSLSGVAGDFSPLVTENHSEPDVKARAAMNMTEEELGRRYRLTLKDGTSRVLTGVKIIGEPGEWKSLQSDIQRIEDVSDLDRSIEVSAGTFQQKVDQLLSYDERNRKELQRLEGRYQHRPEISELFKKTGEKQFPVFFVDRERFDETYGELVPEHRAIFARSKLSDAQKLETVAYGKYHEKKLETLPHPWDAPSSIEYAEPHVRAEAEAIAAGAIARDKVGESIEPGSYSAFYLKRVKAWLDMFHELAPSLRDRRAHEFALVELIWEIDNVRTIQTKGNKESGPKWFLGDGPPPYTSGYFIDEYSRFMGDD